MDHSNVYLQITPRLPYLVSIHQMALPLTADSVRPFNCSLQLIYRPRKDERLSWPSRLTYSGRFTHTSG